MTLDLSDPPAAVLEILARSANDRSSPWRWPVLVTRGDAFPGARMLVVRGFDRTAKQIELHSDARSDKIWALQADPACALVFFDKASMVQLRVDGRADIFTGAGANAAFERAPHASRGDYTGYAPGDDPDAPTSPMGEDARVNFAAIRIRMARADLLVISRDGHTRRFVDFSCDPPRWRRAAP